MDRDEMLTRTKDFAIRIIRLVAALPKDRQGDVLGRQLLKSGTSIGANYREAIHASSKRHFATTLEIAQREAHETLYWLELIKATGMIPSSRLDEIVQESRELLAILTASARTAKDRSRTP
ncbi:MAG: four helix bundle protein [Phycisphaerales bacterium JB063]